MNINRLVETMTREEKVALVSGYDQWHTVEIPRLGIPSIMVSDGPHGLRKQGAEGDHLGIGISTPSTCFPPAATSANSWDPGLLYAMGQAIGKKRCRKESGCSRAGVNIKRSASVRPQFEYFSEDPWLAEKLAKGWIEGVQSIGVGACIKHFAAKQSGTLAYAQ